MKKLTLLLFVAFAFAFAQSPIVVTERHHIGAVELHAMSPLDIDVEYESILGESGAQKYVIIGGERLDGDAYRALYGAIPRLLELYREWQAEQGGPQRAAIFLDGLSLEVIKADTTSFRMNGQAIADDEVLTAMNEFHRLLGQAIAFTR